MEVEHTTARWWRSIRAPAKCWPWSAGPTFDPNKFAVRIKCDGLEGNLPTIPDNPLLNRAIQAQQAPGSTFKPIVALAALETGTIDDKFTVHCRGGVSSYGHYYHC